MSIVMIAAIGKNNELGKKKGLIWHLPLDLKFFKERTMNKTVIMGQTTFESLPKLLPGRKHVVLTFDDISFGENVDVYKNINDVLDKYKSIPEEVFIIGGGQIYKAFLPFADKMYLTEIDAEDKEAEVFFPKFNKEEWKRTVLDEIEDNGIKCEHVEYERL
jgi:dihydrofolate reductase